MFVPHSEHSQKVDYEKSENILAKTLRIESGPFLASPGKRRRNKPLIGSWGRKTGVFSVSVWVPWGFRGVSVFAHYITYCIPLARGPICRNLPIPADTYSTEL